MITVFTPTYNRAKLLPRLFESLKKQSNKDFEWLIVDDGSSDGTKQLVDQWIDDAPFIIRYVYQENGGKHRAINRGAQMADGELFFIVDSDDLITPTALAVIESVYDKIKHDTSFAGVAGLKCLPNGRPTGGYLNKEFEDWYMPDRSYNMDMAEVYKTSVIRMFPFPDFPGEFFCAESLVWNRIGMEHRVRYFNIPIYICEYLEDGLSKASIINRRNSPSYATLLYKEQLSKRFPLKLRIKSSINYWRFWFLRRPLKIDMLPFYVYFFLPIGLAHKLFDDHHLVRKKLNN